MENKHSKYYICLDREDYTVYIEEKEVLLQAGLVAKVESVEYKQDKKLTIFNLFVSDKLVEREKRKRSLDFILPILILGVKEL